MEWPEWLKSLGAKTLEPDPEPAMATVDLEPQQSLEIPSWIEQLDQTLADTEQEQTATLEFLDNDLRSQGFVPLQPGTLATFAEEPSLSSALAELGNFTADAVTPEEPVAQVNSETFTQDPVPLEAESRTFEPVDNSADHLSQETPLIPAYREDALLEDDLETTMKRPAIRLQSMQQSDTLSMLAKGRVGERGKAHDEAAGGLHRPRFQHRRPDRQRRPSGIFRRQSGLARTGQVLSEGIGVEEHKSQRRRAGPHRDGDDRQTAGSRARVYFEADRLGTAG